MQIVRFEEDGASAWLPSSLTTLFPSVDVSIRLRVEHVSPPHHDQVGKDGSSVSPPDRPVAVFLGSVYHVCDDSALVSCGGLVFSVRRLDHNVDDPVRLSIVAKARESGTESSAVPILPSRVTTSA